MGKARKGYYRSAVNESMDTLRAEIREIMTIAREQAVEAGVKDCEGFARKMVEAAMRGKVDRWILESRVAR